jgi:hypothetical protein
MILKIYITSKAPYLGLLTGIILQPLSVVRMFYRREITLIYRTSALRLQPPPTLGAERTVIFTRPSSSSAALVVTHILQPFHEQEI